MQVFIIKMYGLAAQQVLDLDVADTADRDSPMGYLVEARNDLGLDRYRPAEVDDASDLLSPRIVDRNDNLLDAKLIHQPRQVGGRPEDLDPADSAAKLAGVIIDEAADLELSVRPTQHLFRQGRTHTSRADEKRRLPSCTASRRTETVLFIEFVKESPQDPQRKKAAKTKQITDEGRAYLQTEFAKMNLEFVPSHANFVLVKVGDGNTVFQKMLDKGVIVRAMAEYKLPAWVRISVGTMPQMKKAVEVFRTVLATPVAASQH